MSGNQDTSANVYSYVMAINWTTNTYSEIYNYNRLKEDIYVGAVSSNNYFFYRQLGSSSDVNRTPLTISGEGTLTTLGHTGYVLSNVSCLEDATFCFHGKNYTSTFRIQKFVSTSPYSQSTSSTLTYRVDWINFQKGTNLLIGGSDNSTKGIVVYDHTTGQ